MVADSFFNTSEILRKSGVLLLIFQENLEQMYEFLLYSPSNHIIIYN